MRLCTDDVRARVQRLEGHADPFETPIATTTANGVTLTSPHSFTVLDKTDLVVKTELSGVVSYPVEGVDYGRRHWLILGSITFASPPASGTGDALPLIQP